VVLTRSDGAVFWAMRPTSSVFLGGFHVFPGGAATGEDGQAPLAGEATGEVAPLVCAARELFEEVGVIALAGRGLIGADARTGYDWAGARARLLADEVGLGELLEEAGEALDAARYAPVGTWTTPGWVPRRFRTEFYRLEVADGEPGGVGGADLAPLVHAAELERPEWVTPADALARHLEAAALMATPTVEVMRALEAGALSPLARCDQADREDALSRWAISAGLYCVALRSPTIPPSTHTNCYMVGQERFMIVDPGSAYEDQLEVLFEAIDMRIARGDAFAGVLLTHHHVDHVSGLEAVVARYRKSCELEVLAHEETARLVAGSNMGEVTRTLADGERVELGEDTLECVFTPGHAPGHLTFWHERTGLAISGDVVASWGTIVVAPPDGHMGAYLASLERLRERGPRALLPAHGFVIADARGKLDAYTAHRLAREEKVRAALERREGWCEASDLVAEVYDDAPRSVWHIAAFSLFSHLEHLAELGHAARDGDRFKRR
jgi:glyoxylase-like metal-dependent hydrolase (beta-lactamase superfamily II)/8-oxo-dGTP pyrophosphatase MutT (NUDIX family)